MKNKTNNRASDDLESADKLRTILKDLREARQAKSRDGLRLLDTNALLVRTVSQLLYMQFDHDK